MRKRTVKVSSERMKERQYTGLWTYVIQRYVQSQYNNRNTKYEVFAQLSRLFRTVYKMLGMFTDRNINRVYPYIKLIIKFIYLLSIFL